MENQAMTTSEALHFLETLDFEGEDANKFYKYMLRLGDIREITDAFQSLTPTPDPHTGLVPCGCGGKAILFHQPDIEGPGSDGDRWAVFCEKTCGMETSELTSREYAVETWNTGMGYKGGAE